MMFFDSYPEFIESDVRKNRPTTTISSESLSKRCEVLLPKWFIEGKTILDLGHCMGAFGHWALSNGASHYTGVDIQTQFCEKSKTLLGKYWDNSKFTIVQSDVENFLKTTTMKYDIIVAAGVIHGYMNPIGLVQLMSDVSSEYIVIESQKVDEEECPAIKFKLVNMVSNRDGLPYEGWTSLIGYDALRAVMHEFNFELYGDRLYPKEIIGGHDSFNDNMSSSLTSIFGLPQRYMARYKKRNTKKNSLQYKIRNNLQEGKRPNIKYDSNVNIQKAVRWKFDAEVAKRFQQEAATNIPDYERVIDLCIDIAKERCDPHCHIVDVGSALGHTIEKFTDAGFINVSGIESSKAMIENSAFSSCVTLSETFPVDWNTNFVMANWTLHFVNERKQYIQDVYTSLSLNGTFILTDKTPQSDAVKKLYYDFKRANGISDEYIYEKEEKLKGYMNLLPIDWYLDTLKEVGFTNIQIINSRYGFVTFYSEK
jgi:2-polyprenyl-3-methyl-5-hydroxy-6-metoxy-1,4-benzoquinol methylase